MSEFCEAKSHRWRATIKGSRNISDLISVLRFAYHIRKHLRFSVDRCFDHFS